MPIFANGESGRPMRYGTTYIVRPFIDPSKIPASLRYASAGSIQLFAGPASAFVGVQTNVSSSVRATSFGFERA